MPETMHPIKGKRRCYVKDLHYAAIIACVVKSEEGIIDRHQINKQDFRISSTYSYTSH